MLAEISADSRTAAGRFAPGRSGNPAGRPKGARNRATLAAEALFAENAEGLATKLVEGALGGDGEALRFVIGRFLPAAKDRPIALDLAPGKEGDLLHLHAVLMRALADGEITPDEAAKVARVLAVGAKLLELQRKLRKEAAGASKAPLPNPPPPAGEGDAAPVSNLYSATKTAQQAPSPACGGGMGRGEHGPAPVEPKRSLPTPAGAAPVSGLYFESKSPAPAGRPGSRAALRSSTVLGASPVSDLYFSRAA